jgi:hypothetical protein
VWRYAGSLDVRCVRTCVCNPAALKAAEELHARSKGYLTSVLGHLRCLRQPVREHRTCRYRLPSSVLGKGGDTPNALGHLLHKRKSLSLLGVRKVCPASSSTEPVYHLSSLGVCHLLPTERTRTGSG